jgi:hypothetical protein
MSLAQAARARSLISAVKTFVPGRQPRVPKRVRREHLKTVKVEVIRTAKIELPPVFAPTPPQSCVIENRRQRCVVRKNAFTPGKRHNREVVTSRERAAARGEAGRVRRRQSVSRTGPGFTAARRRSAAARAAGPIRPARPGSSWRCPPINSYAVPQLNAETVAAGSAQIDSVSGATYTSGGYVSSLQSAVDKAGL